MSGLYAYGEHTHQELMLARSIRASGTYECTEQCTRIRRALSQDPFKRCCYIAVDSGTTALQNDACTYRCISNKCTIKPPFSRKGYIRSMEIYEIYITMFYLEKNKLVDNIILTLNHAFHITQSG
jgi:hypothetical protein